MAHPLLNKPRKNRSPEEEAGRKTLARNQYIGEVFVGRRKVYEVRKPTETEAFAAANHMKDSQYKNTNAQVQVRKTKAKGDN